MPALRSWGASTQICEGREKRMGGRGKGRGRRENGQVPDRGVAEGGGMAAAVLRSLSGDGSPVSVPILSPYTPGLSHSSVWLLTPTGSRDLALPALSYSPVQTSLPGNALFTHEDPEMPYKRITSLHEWNAATSGVEYCNYLTVAQQQCAGLILPCTYPRSGPGSF